MARRTKAEAEATREALLDAAEEVFFDNGVARTSLEQIARHAGLTRGAVYWHFKNKADLFRAMLDRVRMPFEALVAEAGAVHASPLETVRLGFQESLLRLEQPRRRRVLAILIHRCEFFDDIDPCAIQAEMAGECLDALGGYFAEAHRLGLLKEGVDPEIATRLLQAILSGLFHDWLRDPDAYSIHARGMALVDAQLALIGRDQTEAA
ncbi:HTH-type transcriptional regulator TtgR [Halomonas sp. THAF5a]|uniref:TetR family transcriptional regulator n=1 Tax=Halomonas sp. THAF5a TaxID=2587844 RepID=UPI001267FA9C|nr:TetR family transcriptional regulator [Halomonas sp. THAF5a]QFU00894.1 HTH-type transcriptional regulator TtgR [Halomonas sp. THAF5a]